MEQIQNMVLGMLQELTTPKAPAKDDKADGNFKDLMEQYGQSAKDKVEEPKPEQAEETPKAENPQEAKPGEEPQR